MSLSKKKLAVEGGEPVIRSALPGGGHGLDLIDESEVEAVSNALLKKKLWRYDEGSQCNQFEQEVCEYLGVKHAVFVNSGTTALICALSGLDIGPGDEVIVPGYTYIATAAAVVNVGAVPVICEIDDSLGIDPEDMQRKITPYTKAVIPVHMRGVPCRLDQIRRIADEHDLHVVEDCCQAIGSSYKGKKTGTQSTCGAWSLNYYKIITTGESGLMFTNDSRVFERALFASEPALPMWFKNNGWNTPPFSSSNFRGNELLAAIARVQFRKLPDILNHCRKLKAVLLNELNEAPQCYKHQHIDDPEGECGIGMAIIAHNKELAEKMSAALSAEGVGVGTAYNDGFPDRHVYSYWDSIINKNGATPKGYPWNDPAYEGSVEYRKDMCPQTLDILGRALRIGLHVNLNENHVKKIAQAINKVDSALA